MTHIDGRKETKKIELEPEHGELNRQEQEVLQAARKAQQQKKPSTGWKDIPPILDPESIVSQAVLEDALENANDAKVGDTYLEYATDIKAADFKKGLRQIKKKLAKGTADLEEDEPELKTVKQGYKVWQVLQPKWTEEDRKKADALHNRYVAPYAKWLSQSPKRNDFDRDPARDTCEQSPVKRWPKDRFPNGQYWTDRWVPKVWHDQQQEWLPASEEDCRTWEKIPETKKRVDFLFGVLPDE